MIIAPPPPTAPSPSAPSAATSSPATPDRRARRLSRTTEGLGLPVDLAVTGVTAAVAVALVRAFRTWDELWPLLLIVVLAHGLSALARRLRISATPAVLGLVAIGAVVLTVMYYRGQSFYGLPTPSVLSHALADARTAFGPFQKLVAPVDALPGFTVTFAAGLWLMAVFADLAVGRSDAPLQAVAPHLAVFVFSSVLLLGRDAVLATVVMVTALVVYRLAVRASRLRRDTAAPVAKRTSIIWILGLPMLAVVLLTGTMFSRAAPTTKGGLIDLRSIGRGPDARVVESPLVSLDSLLGAESSQVLFTVQSALPHYWRLTALDDFDGRSWSASAKYRDLDSDEDISTNWGSGVVVNRERATVRLSGLNSDWLPAAFSPQTVRAPIDLRYDDGSGSVFVSDGESTSNLTYDVTSDVPDLDKTVLHEAGSPVDPSLTPYLALPATFSDEVHRRADEITASYGAFDAAVALEKYFRSSHFVYDRRADYRDSTDPLLDFLNTGRGFCQQFATAFAAMARSVGIPARVAVGFTYGDKSTATDPKSGIESTTWTVKGQYAHAWPEVYINDVGWVAFEPTPGRGNPDSTTYSDVAPSQSDDAGGSIELGATTTTTTTTVVPAGGVVPTTLPDQEPNKGNASPATTPTDTSSNGPTIVLLVIVGLALVTGSLVAARKTVVRRRRTRHRGGGIAPADRVAESWRQTCRDLARVDIHARPSETPIEFATRAAKLVEIEGLVTLGKRESDRRFRATPPDLAEAEGAESISDGVREVVWSRLDRRQKLAADLDLGSVD